MDDKAAVMGMAVPVDQYFTTFHCIKMLGFSDRANMLIVCHCYRGENDIIRLISAREATSNEKKRYQKGW